MPQPRPYDMAMPSIAMATVAGPGPKSSAEVTKKVSETENRALLPGIFSAKRPLKIARPPNSSHSNAWGVRGSA